MSHRVVLTRHALSDLHELAAYITRHDSHRAANHVLVQLERAITSLSRHPQRGSYVPELLDLAIKEYRQLSLKPWRVIYRLLDRDVVVMLIVDSRRDLAGVLERRLLEG
jgi:toxin ParE1/3/4